MTETLWPDFNRALVAGALLEFQKRERRYGGIRKAKPSDEKPVRAAVIDPLSGEAGKHPNVKSLRHVRRSNLSGMRAVCRWLTITHPPLFFVVLMSK